MEGTSEHLPDPVALEMGGERDPKPFSQTIVQLTQAEHIELKWQGNGIVKLTPST